MCVRTWARMRRMYPSVRIGVCVCALSGGRRATATFHLGSTVPMYIITCTVGGCACTSRHPFSQIYIVYGHPSIFRYMYFGAASRRACECGGCARGCARVGLHLPQGSVAAPNAPVCLSRARGCVFRACAVTFHGFGPFAPTSAHRRAAGAGRHAGAVRGRYISGTKVRALPEWLGQCKLLEELCVPRPSPPPPCAFAVVPALRCCAWRCRAGALEPPRAALYAAAAALPVVGRGRAPRAHGWRVRPTGARSGLGRSRPARPHRRARRFASDTELAALPAAADWPNLKTL
jgi:hypothetical protein